MDTSLQQFGGDWTERKLCFIESYLTAYRKVMTNQSFTLYYIDPFAGTGYNTIKEGTNDCDLLFRPEGKIGRTDGSARRALRIPRPFHRNIFIEQDQKRCEELKKLKDEFSLCSIDVICGDANNELVKLCRSIDWHHRTCPKRAVVFLDPFGMQVEWTTIQAVAETKAIDLWLLFPVGIGVNRMLARCGQFQQGWSERLDKTFGEHNWYNVFYSTIKSGNLFGGCDEIPVKTADWAAIGNYFLKRLHDVFSGVADNPVYLHNSANCPIYMLCFASGNPKGAVIATRIAQDILSRK